MNATYVKSLGLLLISLVEQLSETIELGRSQ